MKPASIPLHKIVIGTVCLCVCCGWFRIVSKGGLLTLSHAEESKGKSFDEVHGRLITLLNIDPNVRFRPPWDELVSDLRSVIRHGVHKQRALYDLAVATKKLHERYPQEGYHVTFKEVIATAKEQQMSEDLLDDFYYLEFEYLSAYEPESAAKIRGEILQKFPDSDSSFKLLGSRGMDSKKGSEVKRPIGTVVIDAGHGGEDFGAVSRNHIYEKDLALLYSRVLKQELAARNVRTVFTRSGDEFLPLVERTAIANGSSAQLFISLHFNAASNAGIRGIEMFYLGKVRSEDIEHLVNRENRILGLSKQQQDLTFILGDFIQAEKVEESKQFAAAIYDELRQSEIVQNLGMTLRKPRPADFYVLVGSKIPALLLELPYLSNEDDLRVAVSEKFRRQAMIEVAEAIRSILLAKKKS